jgi:hypothetical protein
MDPREESDRFQAALDAEARRRAEGCTHERPPTRGTRSWLCRRCACWVVLAPEGEEE